MTDRRPAPTAACPLPAPGATARHGDLRAGPFLNLCRNVSTDPVQTPEKGMIDEAERIADTLCAITSLVSCT
ncbi:hypothetical protein [Streptomyces sp. NBC_01435]|uniref:hypothetical protein n=1 Tax=Streptomyces sp. NBC_01435 TaxID=2903865 RepID=UPI002E31CF8D|nr:hypothetical protein [Streptomyces sp. NBC_01435]